MTFFHVKPASQFDPVALLPKSLAKNKRFETIFDARVAWSANRERMLGDQFLCEAIDAIDTCVAGGQCCNRPACPRCGRSYRRWLSSRILVLLSMCSQAYMLTIYGGLFARGELSETDVRLFHDRIRKRMRRAGFGRTVAIGGTEVSWQADLNGWLLHLHVVVIDPPPGAIESLRRPNTSEMPGSPAIRKDAIRDPAIVATYVQKFLPIHHPGHRTGKARSRAVPLPNCLAREYARFLLRHEFQDFLFLYACRRRGSRIAVL
jgi:hypothetical protein